MQTWALAYQARNTLGTPFAILLIKKVSESQEHMNTNGQSDFSEASGSKTIVWDQAQRRLAVSENGIKFQAIGEKAMALRLLDLSRIAVEARSVEDLARNIVLEFTAILQPSAAFIHIIHPQRSFFFQCGFEPQEELQLKNLLHSKYRDTALSELPPSKRLVNQNATSRLPTIYPLRYEQNSIGFLGILLRGNTNPIFSPSWNAHLDLFLRLLADSFSKLFDQSKYSRRMRYFNTYLTVSSMLAHSSNLHELIETALYCCLDDLSAEAASILFYQAERDEFCFYHVEGPARPVLITKKFSANKGIAGAVFHTQEAQIINDVQNDRRFFRELDSLSGFTTKNMIAVPLVALEERVGVFEVLNKREEAFNEEEKLLTTLIAEEISFAARNAWILELAMNSYCKRLQGQTSCKGCQRPREHWAPCIKSHAV